MTAINREACNTCNLKLLCLSDDITTLTWFCAACEHSFISCVPVPAGQGYSEFTDAQSANIVRDVKLYRLPATCKYRFDSSGKFLSGSNQDSVLNILRELILDNDMVGKLVAGNYAKRGETLTRKRIVEVLGQSLCPNCVKLETDKLVARLGVTP